MEKLTPRDRRLLKEHESMKKLVEDSSFVRFQAEPDDLPEHYVVTFSCLGLVVRPDLNWGLGGLPPDWRRRRPLPPFLGESHQAKVYLPADFPRKPPQIRFTTKVYHPNIKYWGPEEMEAIAKRHGFNGDFEEVLRRNPELQNKVKEKIGSYICLDGIQLPSEKGSYSLKITLYDICAELGQMIMYQRYNVNDYLDQDAASWTAMAELQKNVLPIDNRPFFDNLEPVIHLIKQDDVVIDIEER